MNAVREAVVYVVVSEMDEDGVARLPTDYRARNSIVCSDRCVGSQGLMPLRCIRPISDKLAGGLGWSIGVAQIVIPAVSHCISLEAVGLNPIFTDPASNWR